jgi:signal transduction histidine kinase
LNTSVGIGQEKQAFIFDGYWKIDSLHGRRQEGGGLELAIVERMLEFHDISIRVESHISQGSIFKFYTLICQP